MRKFMMCLMLELEDGMASLYHQFFWKRMNEYFKNLGLPTNTGNILYPPISCSYVTPTLNSTIFIENITQTHPKEIQITFILRLHGKETLDLKKPTTKLFQETQSG